MEEVLIDDEFGEKSVSVLLDGEESEMIFIDHPSTEMSDAKQPKLASSRTHISLSIARELLQKICINDISKSKSCENLHVL
ncbi:hypothetical protein HF086_000415 [Spodoptera exigua]|uniref:Uncharacterized protein n=1 Tax=Spodoptera exigua TaxID=7107 RepID=A0A922M7Y7_SPOEX|nr:hypothetical protein HF086_000415 [Spodoptera exigua]